MAGSFARKLVLVFPIVLVENEGESFESVEGLGTSTVESGHGVFDVRSESTVESLSFRAIAPVRELVAYTIEVSSIASNTMSILHLKLTKFLLSTVLTVRFSE